MQCPHCFESKALTNKGFFLRKTGLIRRVQRGFCRACRRGFSTQTDSKTKNERRPELNDAVLALLVSGVSQRRTAILLKTTQKTVARKVQRLGAIAKRCHDRRLADRLITLRRAVFDEMETFEHSKCKPLAIAVAVEDRTRYLLAANVAKMPAHGKLAAISIRRYGVRPDHRRHALRRSLTTIANLSSGDLTLLSDQCPRYPALVKKVLPTARHVTLKGRRGCVVGQSELKRGGFDPLFSLNHTCAMLRDNLKRLARRTWCTTKRIDRLQSLLNIYICFHNELIDWRRSKKDPTFRPPVDALFLTPLVSSV